MASADFGLLCALHYTREDSVIPLLSAAVIDTEAVFARAHAVVPDEALDALRLGGRDVILVVIRTSSVICDSHAAELTDNNGSAAELAFHLGEFGVEL